MSQSCAVSLREAGEQKRELEIISEILSVAQEKFHEFIIGAIGFIDENEVLIRRHPEGDADTGRAAVPQHAHGRYVSL